MPNPSKPYICPRCFYETPLKKRIKRHFEESKTPCTDRGGLELTKEIMELVYKNHTHVENVLENHATGIKPPNVNQTVNQYNTYQNIISNMECCEKLKFMLGYNNTRHVDFEDKLECEFQYRIKKLESDEYTNGFYMNTEGLLKMIDGATKINDDELQNFNVLFDKTVNRVKLLSCGKWDSYLEEYGIIEVIKLIKSYFFDTYEVYLIKNIDGGHEDLSKNRFVLKEHLELYYNFISCFELEPVVFRLNDENLVGYFPKENHNSLAQFYQKSFADIKKNLKTSDKNKVIRRVTNIVKENTSHNIMMLNKIMFDLLKTDKTFLGDIPLIVLEVNM